MSAVNSFDWFAPISNLKGVGSKIAEKLAQLNIHCIGDLLLHCPYRYENRTQLTPIKALQIEQSVVIQGKIINVKLEGKRKKRANITLTDQTGVISLLFFNFHPNMQKSWVKDTTLRCFGQVKANQYGYVIIHPECEIITQDKPLPQHLTGVYPVVAGLSQAWLRRTISSLLATYQQYLTQKDHFADALSPCLPMLPWLQALTTIHQPKADENIEALISRQHPAYLRLISEELYSHYISLKKLKGVAKAKTAKALKVSDSLLHAFIKELPFELTMAQQKVCAQIHEDLKQQTPMLRLVQGDVGSGKTVVAAIAALAALDNSTQVAIMAPTEILAEQHLAHFKAWFEKFGYRCQMLSGKLKAKEKRDILENIALGLTQVVIGTHALFQDNVQFKELGLVIIDEQHRFGVHQRLALHIKGQAAINANTPHQLIMTATPIPRTLAMSHYAHLDISIIDSLPPNRQPITTLTVGQKRKEEVIDKLKSICAKKQQAYWVCTLIEESETLQCQAAQSTQIALQEALPYKVGLIHGKMETSEKESIMQAFYRNEISVLVATTVIEVGVNVPNATLMVIENPERLGLAQLHQLRGRVGRGSEASFCILLYQSPLSEMAQARLKIMRQTQDGFVIAEEDLTLRGPGEVLGVRQTGELQFKVADFKRDKAYFELLSEWEAHLKDFSETALSRICQKWNVKADYAQA
ncbi:MAG: ATP-dependent DNA helicase RecG [Proteobacteria bacterium]|nr:ATP-dependent DNA helicase RecG [Pseudomonadota bacterium]